MWLCLKLPVLVPVSTMPLALKSFTDLCVCWILSVCVCVCMRVCVCPFMCSCVWVGEWVGAYMRACDVHVHTNTATNSKPGLCSFPSHNACCVYLATGCFTDPLVRQWVTELEEIRKRNSSTHQLATDTAPWLCVLQWEMLNFLSLELSTACCLV